MDLLKVEVTFSARELWLLSDLADERGVSLASFIRSEMNERHVLPKRPKNLVHVLVSQGFTDGEISVKTGLPRLEVARLRRALDLKPNKSAA